MAVLGVIRRLWRRWRTRAAWLTLVGVVIFQGVQLRALVADESREDEIEEAQRCVSSWEVREEIRNATEMATRAGSHISTQALVLLYQEVSPGDPELVARFMEIASDLAEDDVAAVRRQIGDPACDLEQARRLLNQ